VVAVRYVIIGIVAIAAVVAATLTLLPPKPHRAPIQYIGSPSGFEAFAPSDQTVNYNGHTDPVGTLILPNGTTLPNAVWNGKYADTIIQNHNQIIQLNSQFVGQTDPVNNQPYVPLQDFYVIKGQVPIQQVTINGQTYYVILAGKINPGDLAGFLTNNPYQFIAAINMPGTTPAKLLGNSPIYNWPNVTGTVTYQTKLYGQYGSLAGGYVLVLPNKTIIPYGAFGNVAGASFNNFYVTNQIYNPSS